jgi:hypothetical protein
MAFGGRIEQTALNPPHAADRLLPDCGGRIVSLKEQCKRWH